LQSSRVAVSASKCQGGRVFTPGIARTKAGRRALLVDQYLGKLQPLELRRQRLRILQARHAEPPAGELQPRDADAAGAGMYAVPSSTSRRASSRPSSVTVPGVTTRTTRRSTGPFESAGSPICSQIATDSPLRTSFAR
jgi:hypothetical protein